jgi:hypothetical protein
VLSNLVIAGAWTDTGWPATIESAVRSGRTAALTLFSNAAAWPAAQNTRNAGSAREVARAV